MASVDEAKAALTVAELEAELVAAKQSGDRDKLQTVKYQLRDARQVYREMREARAPADGEARPEPIKAKVKPPKARADK